MIKQRSKQETWRHWSPVLINNSMNAKLYDLLVAVKLLCTKYVTSHLFGLELNRGKSYWPLVPKDMLYDLIFLGFTCLVVWKCNEAHWTCTVVATDWVWELELFSVPQHYWRIVPKTWWAEFLLVLVVGECEHSGISFWYVLQSRETRRSNRTLKMKWRWNLNVSK
jgi:hypothetical protein